MQIRNDTIAAVSTPLGRGAIAIIRLSGCDAHQFGAKLANPWPRVARQVTLSTIRDARDASVLDRVLITRFDAPHSYTGEPMVEMACHGGLAVSGAILEALVSLGARPADAGEFSQRAVLNGKMDLLQAEGVADLIDARTQALRRAALSQIDGSLTRALGELRERAIEVEALLAYDIDFPEEDDGPISRDAISVAVDSTLAAISRLLNTVPLGEVARDGALVVIAGPPNAGKSSLFNALLGHTRSIVAELAGTTRDAIEARVESERWPLRLVDTAGLRETTDLVEQLGIEVSEHYLQLAQVVLVCAETPEMLVECVHRISGIGTAERVAVLTKSDRRVAGENAGVIIEHSSVVEVSAVSRDGLERLLSEIHLALERRVGALDPDLPMVTRMRHRIALEQARSELHQFTLHWEQRELPSSVAAIHVRTAIHALDELIGSVDVEDVLDRVFRTFCVGK